MAESAKSSTPMPGRFGLTLRPGEVDISLENLPGVGKKTAAKMRERGYLNQLDLALTFPRRYRQTHRFYSGADLTELKSEYAKFLGRIQNVRVPHPRSKAPVEVNVESGGALFRLFWFNMRQAWFAKQFKRGAQIMVEGPIEWGMGYPRMAHPTVKVFSSEQVSPAQSIDYEPIYTSHEDLQDNAFLKSIRASVTNILPWIDESTPAGRVAQEFDVPTIGGALTRIHLLDKNEDLRDIETYISQARYRLVFEEFYSLQLELAAIYVDKRRLSNSPRLGERELGREFVRSLPFKLTGEQGQAIAKIADELNQPVCMRRLLQGDVGSGKTVVAFMAAAISIGSGYQAVLMAPTEVLAQQHFENAKTLFKDSGVQVGVLSGSLNAADRASVLEALAVGNVDLLIGTHSVFQKDVEFADGGDRLALVIIDEQHKFGVDQRDALLAKGRSPHLLAMTATPIPRSLAHTLFGDLDLTVIREKPPGRKPIKTYLRGEDRALKVHEYARTQIEAGARAFYVYPMIETSERTMGRASVTEAAEYLANGPFRGLRLGVLHGRMKGDAKAEVMDRFKHGELDVLCATTVIEVGVDVPEATLMVISDAEMFGLSQLHQLRGRVGRGEEDSMCVVIASNRASDEALDRLRAFESTEDGFRLAELDLVHRGAGLLLGARQAGASEFRFGDILRDSEVLEFARSEARRQLFGDVGE